MLFDTVNRLIIEHCKTDNQSVLRLIERWEYEAFAIERVASFGFKVGQTIFDTIEWQGRFLQAALFAGKAKTYDRLFRKSVVAFLCGTATANDTKVRASLLARYGKEYLKGLNSSDQRSALAIATVWADGLREKETSERVKAPDSEAAAKRTRKRGASNR